LSALTVDGDGVVPAFLGEGDGGVLVALTVDGDGVVPAFLGEVVDVDAADLRDPQPVEQQQTRHRVERPARGLGGVEPVRELMTGQPGLPWSLVARRPADRRDGGGVGQAALDQPAVGRGQYGEAVADGVDRADLAFEPADVELDLGALDGERVELVGGASREPAVQLLEVGASGVGVAVAGQERAGQRVQTKLEGWVEDGHGDIRHDGAPDRGTHVTRPTEDPSPHSRGWRA
jgi:hypothetical protein